MMPHSIFFTAARDQSPSLWVKHGAMSPANPSKTNPEGSAVTAPRFCDCEPDPEAFCERRQEAIPSRRHAILRPANVRYSSLLRFHWRQASLRPTVALANPTASEISEVVFASAGDSSIPSHPSDGQTGPQSMRRTPAECCDGIELRRLPLRHTSGMEAASPAADSSCGCILGKGIVGSTHRSSRSL
jgi:hypothetical protein